MVDVQVDEDSAPASAAVELEDPAAIPIDTETKVRVAKRTHRLILGIAVAAGAVLALLGLVFAVEMENLFPSPPSPPSGKVTVTIVDPRSTAKPTTHTQPNPISPTSSNKVMEALLSPRIVRGLVIGGLGLVLLAVVAFLIHLLATANMTVLEPDPLPVDPEKQPVKVETTMVERAYRWCQDAMPERVDFAASLCCGYLLSMLFLTLYPNPTNPLTTGMIAVAITALSLCSVLFLPPIFVAVVALVVLLSVMARWSTYHDPATPMDQLNTKLGKLLGRLSKSPHLVNLSVAAVVAVYAVITWSQLDISLERGGWESWAMGPMLSAALMAAIGQVLINRQAPGYMLHVLYLVVGVGGALVFSYLFDTVVVLELVATVLVWLYCRHFMRP